MITTKRQGNYQPSQRQIAKKKKIPPPEYRQKQQRN